MSSKKEVTEAAPWISGEGPPLPWLLSLHYFRLDHVPKYREWWSQHKDAPRLDSLYDILSKYTQNQYHKEIADEQ